MSNIFITRMIPQAGIDHLKKHCKVVEINPEDRVLTAEELKEKVKGRDAVLCLLTDVINDEVYEAAGAQCKIFANMAVGYNNLDLEAASKRNIIITNTPGVLSDATADMAWALLFSTARRIVESDAHIRSGKWEGWGPLQFIGQDITGRTLGIIGAGRIGTNFALKSIGFNMKVLYCDPNRNEELESKLGARKVELKELLLESDFVSLHVFLSPETRHLISEKELNLMKESAVLINSARGPVIDEQALVNALKNGAIAAAGLDVYEFEPKAVDGLLTLRNVVACPHIASATFETRNNMAVMAARNITEVLAGKPAINPVNEI
ncbi:MAG TPA: 2-hydroxyacid dehydrogenase [Cyclobacteriaceae bacterium]